jgi:hypothetical protein
MMGEYDSARALALRLIKKKGRAGVKVLRVGGGTPSDPARPWKPDGDGPDEENPTSADVEVATVHGVFLNPVEARGSQGQFSFHVYLRAGSDATDSIAPDATYAVFIAAAELPDGVTIEAGMLIESAGRRYSVLQVSELKPADDAILYTVSVKD